MTPPARAALRVAAQVAAAVVLLRLSLWQAGRARAHDSPLNWAYAGEWLLLAVLVLVVPSVVSRRHAGTSAREPASPPRAADGRLLGPPLRPGEHVGDPTSVRVRRLLPRRAAR